MPTPVTCARRASINSSRRTACFVCASIATTCRYRSSSAGDHSGADSGTGRGSGLGSSSSGNCPPEGPTTFPPTERGSARPSRHAPSTASSTAPPLDEPDGFPSVTPSLITAIAPGRARRRMEHPTGRPLPAFSSPTTARRENQQRLEIQNPGGDPAHKKRPEGKGGVREARFPTQTSTVTCIKIPRRTERLLSSHRLGACTDPLTLPHRATLRRPRLVLSASTTAASLSAASSNPPSSLMTT